MIDKNTQEKIEYRGTIRSVQPRSNVWRYRLDNRTHSMTGYNIFLSGGMRTGNGNQEYLTVQEAALLAGRCRRTVDKWMEMGCFPVKKAGNLIRIPRKDFEKWLDDRRDQSGHSHGDRMHGLYSRC